MISRLWLIGLLAVASPTQATSTGNDPLLTDRSWLQNVLVYSYYWYLDDRFFVELEANQGVPLWVRSIEPAARDDQDQSRYGELWFPQSGLRLRVKQADYPISEFQLRVRSPHYRVIRGEYEAPGEPRATEAWTAVFLPKEDLETWLAEARTHLHRPRPERREFVLRALRKEMERTGLADQTQTFYLAARTEVSNSIWVYGVEQRVLWVFSGDLDGVSPADMEHLPLSLQRYSLNEQVVASIAEARGNTTGAISRERASRALFLCLTRGEAVRLGPQDRVP